jgi:AraC-like DNA-binding protein
VLFFERTVEPSTSVFTKVRGLTGPDLQLQVIHQRGCRFSSDAFREGNDRVQGRAVTLTICLRGHYRCESVLGLTRLEAGQAAVELRDDWNEEWDGEEQLLCTLVWPGPATPMDPTTLTDVDRRAWTALVRGVLDGSWSREKILCALTVLVERLGVEMPSVPGLPDGRTIAIRRALNRVMTHLHIAPQWQDIEEELGLSERQLRRSLKADAGYLTGGLGLRAYLSQGRLVTGWRLKTAKLGTAEIARALGYRSGRALQTAFRRAGLRTSRL